MTSMRMISLVLFGLVGLRGALLAAEPAASPVMAAQESTASPKETGKGQQNSDGHEGTATKRGASHDTPLPAAPPKPSKEAHEGKPETTPPPAKGKGESKAEGKSEVPKDSAKDASGEGLKTERTGAENATKPGASRDTPLPATPSKPSKESHEGKPEAAPPPAKGKGEGKAEVPKEGAKDVPGEKQKIEDTSTDDAAKREGAAAPSPPAKTSTAPQKRPLGSNILTTKLALIGDPRLFPYDIEVEIDGDKAILSGRVATDEDRRRAEELVQHLGLVDQVINKLEVVKDLGPAIAKRHDQTLVQLVKDRFSRSETLKAAEFDVTCEKGVIHLSGTVRFQVFALEAAQAARQVPGVIAVDTSHVKLIGEGNE